MNPIVIFKSFNLLYIYKEFKKLEYSTFSRIIEIWLKSKDTAPPPHLLSADWYLPCRVLAGPTWRGRLEHANFQVLLLFEDNQIGVAIQVIEFFFFMLTLVFLRGVDLAQGADFPADLDSVQVVALAGEFEKLLGDCVGDFGEQLLGEEVQDGDLLQLAHVVDECIDGQLMWLPRELALHDLLELRQALELSAQQVLELVRGVGSS